MDAREFSLHTRIVLGEGALAHVPELCRGQRVFVVTDEGVTRAGHRDRLVGMLRDVGCDVHCYAEVLPNPDEHDVRACLAVFQHTESERANGAFEWIVALGGGSAIDVAKGCAMLAAGGGRMADYVGRGRIEVATPKLIAIPTTAGTGSETQSFALIQNGDTGQKMACGGSAPSFAVLDPTLSLTMPSHVTACTGLDTLTHAVEAAVSRRSTPWSGAIAGEALRLVDRSFERVLRHPEDLAARADMLHASAMAGVAIENGMLGAAHSMANPLTRHHGVEHGRATGQVLAAVVAFNAEEPPVRHLYAELARSIALTERTTPDAEATAALVRRIEELVAAAGFGPRITGVPTAAADMLAAEAATQWTARFNPRDVGVADFVRLYREVLS